MKEQLSDVEQKVREMDAIHSKALDALRDEIETQKPREIELKLTIETLRKELGAAKKETDMTLQDRNKMHKEMQAVIAELNGKYVDERSRADLEEKNKVYWIFEKQAQDAQVLVLDAEIVVLKKKLAEHNKEVADLKLAAKTLEKTNNALHDNIKQLKADVERSEKEAQKLHVEIEELKRQLEKELESHQIKLLPLDSQIAELRKWLDEALAKNNILTADKNSLEEDVRDTLKRLEDKCKNEADLRERKMPLVENEVKKLQVMCACKDEEIELLKRRLSSVVEEVGKQVLALEKELAIKDPLLEKHKKMISSLEAEIASLRDQLTAMTDKEKEAAKIAKAWEVQCGDLQDTVQELSRTIAAHQNKISSLDAEIASLRNQLTVMTEKEKAAAKSSKAWEVQCGDLQETIQEDCVVISSLQKQTADLTYTLEVADRTIEELKKQLKDLRRMHDRCPSSSGVSHVSYI